MTTAYTEVRQARRKKRGWPGPGWASVLLSALLLTVSVWFVDSRRLLATLSSVDTRWLAAAAVVSVLQLVVLGARYCHIGRALGLPITWVKGTTEYALSILVNQVLPTGILGDGLRAFRQARQSEQGRLGTALEAVALDRAAGFAVLVLVVLSTAPFGPGREVIGQDVLVWGAALGVLACLAVVWLARSSHLRRRIPGILRTGRAREDPGELSEGEGEQTATRRSAPRVALAKLTRDAANVLFAPRHIVVHAPLSLVLILLLLLQLYVAARAVGVELKVGELMWLGPLILLSMSLPSFFGGWGVREGASALAFAALGMPGATGVAVGLVYGAFTLIVSVPFVVVVLFDSERGVSPHTSWSQAHSLCMLAGLGLALWSQQPALLAFAAALSFGFLIAQSKRRWTPSGAFGAANWVTSARLLVILLLLAAHQSLSAGLVVVGACGVLLLDVVDGRLARRWGSASEFGAAYDVEVDTLLVAALALLLIIREHSGLWVTLPLLLRFLYVLLPVVVAPRRVAQSRTWFGRVAYSTMILSFVVALLVPATWAAWLTGFGTLLVSLSFLWSFWCQYGGPVPNH